MLAIRLQRRGRKGLSQFRVILQDSHRSPFSGKVTAYLGSYDPHTKKAQLDREKIEFYLKNGAQPSNRVAMLLKTEGIKLPAWVAIDTSKKGETRNPDKLKGDDAPPAAEEGGDQAADADKKESTDEKIEKASGEDKSERPSEETDKNGQNEESDQKQDEEAPEVAKEDSEDKK